MSKPAPAPRLWLGPAEMARRVGVSAKALRVLERHGLVTPARTAAGWRAYGPEQAARLHQVMVLRQLGLPLSRIADLLAGRVAAPDAVLDFQQQALLARRADIDRALALIQRARDTLARDGTLPPDALIDLIKETTMPTPSSAPEAAVDAWRDVIKPLIDKRYTAEQLAQIRELKTQFFAKAGFDAETFKSAWRVLFDEARALMAADDPDSPQAVALGRRWSEMAGHFVPSDPGLGRTGRAVWDEAMADPDKRGRLPVEELAFVRRILAGMRERGELPKEA